MANLSELRNRLSYYEKSKADYEKKKSDAIVERDKAQKRKDKVKEINNKLKNSFDDNVRIMNKNADDVSQEVEDGIIGNLTSNTVAEEIMVDKEETTENDGNLGEAIKALDGEYTALQIYYDQNVAKIKTYNDRINDLNWNIISTKRDIAAEEARQAAEAARRAAEAAAAAAAKKLTETLLR